MENGKIPFWVMLLALATVPVGVADHGLWTPDEPREAELVASFSRPGASLLYPILAGKPFVEKPPLFYWAAAASLKTLRPLLGEVGAIRAVPALCALLTALITWGAARRFLGPAPGAAAAAVLLTTVFFFQAGHWIVTDPLLMLTVAAAVLLGAWGEEENRPGLILAAFAAAGLSFLAKGLIGPALIAPPALALAILYRKNILASKLLHLAGFALAASVVLAWVIPFKLHAPPESWREWFWDNQVGRFLGRTPELGHLRGPFYYLLVVPLMLLPWTPALIGILTGRRWRREPLGGPRGRLLLVALAWAIGGVLLLSVSGTKRDIYLYPLLPAFAVLTGAFPFRQPRWVRGWFLGLGWGLAVVLLAAGFLRADWDGSALSWGLRVQPWALAAAIGSFWLLLENGLPSLPRTAAVAALFYLGAARAIVPQVDAAKNYEPGTKIILAALPAGDEKTCAWDLDETSRGLLGFYGGLSLFDLHDNHPEGERRKILEDALAGKDERCRYLVAMSKTKPFPPEGVKLDPSRVLATGKLGTRRTLYLLDCAPAGADNSATEPTGGNH